MWGLPVAMVVVAAMGYTPVPPGQAVSALRAAGVKARAEQCMTTTESWPRGTYSYCEGGGELITGPAQPRTFLVMPDGRGYSAVPPGVRDTVRAYLATPALTWAQAEGTFGWPGTFASYAKKQAAIPIVTNVRKAGVSADGRRYSLWTGSQDRATYRLDSAGRLVGMRLVARGRVQLVAYTTTFDRVVIPDPQPAEVLPESRVQPAVDSARIPSRLRKIVRATLPQPGRALPVPALRARAREQVRRVNSRVPTRSAHAHARAIARGVRIFARNTFTGQTHEWRIVRREGRWRAQPV